ncbi:MAG: hypothetical protein ACXWQQ_14420, partial [Pseudobdellovibrio sp.]
MNTTLKNIFVLTISSLGLFSCAVKIGDQQINLTPDITLDGNWSTGCVADGADSYIKSFQSSNGKLEIATFRYTGTRACDQSQLSFSVLFSGTYNVSGDNINLTGAKNYEWKIQSVVETPYEQTLVDSLNASSVCGSNTWAIGQ